MKHHHPSNQPIPNTSFVRLARALSLGLLTAMSFVARSNADTLFTFTEPGSGGGRVVTSTFYAAVSLGTGGDFFSNGTKLFDLAWTVNDVGTTYTANSGNNPNFNAFAAKLENGSTNSFLFEWGFSPGQASQQLVEPFVLFGNASDPRIDLGGQYQLDSISLKLNSLTLDSPGHDPNHDGIWTDDTYNYTLTFNGSPVPEPATGALVVAGLGLFSVVRRLRRA